MSERKERTPWLRLLLLAGIVVGIGWAWHHWAMWPLKVFVVLFHELGHAVAAWATGGEVLEIALSPAEGGHTLTRGGSPLLILNAGYLGSMVAGMGLLAGSRNGLVARGVTAVLGVFMLGVDVMFVPWLSFASWFIAACGLVLLAVAFVIPGFILKWFLRGLGVFSVLYAFLDVWSDVFARALDTSVVSDAVLLEQQTGVPALVWGATWMGLGALLLVLTRKWLV